MDNGTGRIGECHDLAHDAASSEAMCAAIADECVALRDAVDAGSPPGADAGPADAGSHMH